MSELTEINIYIFKQFCNEFKLCWNTSKIILEMYKIITDTRLKLKLSKSENKEHLQININWHMWKTHKNQFKLLVYKNFITEGLQKDGAPPYFDFRWDRFWKNVFKEDKKLLGDDDCWPPDILNNVSFRKLTLLLYRTKWRSVWEIYSLSLFPLIFFCWIP